MIRNERGSLLVYSIFLILLISVITLPLLQMSSTRALTDVRDKNQKIATQLAVSAVEQYLGYLTSCEKPCKDIDRYKLRYFLNGLSATPQIMSLTLPDGTPVTLSMYYQLDGTSNARVITRAVAGDTNRDNIADEKLAGMKEIVYNLNGKKTVTKIINPGNPITIPSSEKIYLDTTSGGNTTVIRDHQPITNLKTELTTYLNALSNDYDQRITAYKQSTISCASATCITNQINRATTEPVVIKLGSTSLSSYTNASNKKVVLVFSSINGDFTGQNVSVLVDNLTVPSSFTLTNGDLMIGNSVEFGNNSSIKITNGSIYAVNFDPTKENSISITADRMVVKNTFDVKNKVVLNIKNEFIVGSINVGNTGELKCSSGDFFVATDFTAGNNTQLTAGGSVAVGGNVDIGGITVTVGGGTTILHPPADGGSEQTEEEIDWSPSRQ